MSQETKNSFFSREKNIFWIFFALYFLLGLLFVFSGVFWTDENWYFGGSNLVARGELLYRDFFVHHNPVFFYVYALPQYLFGPNFIVGRLTSFVIMMVIFVLVWRLSRKLGGKTAALIASGLLVTNLIVIYYYTSFSYRALEECLMLLFFTVLCGSLKDSIKYPLTTFLLCLIVGVRYPIDIISVLLVLYLVYIAYSQWRNKRVILISVSVAVVSLGAIILPFIAIAGDQFFFGTITFPFDCMAYCTELGAAPRADILTRTYHSLAIFYRVVQNFIALVAILIGLAIYVASKVWRRRINARELIQNNRILFFLLVFVILFEGFCALAPTASFGLRSFTFPAAVILGAVGLARILADIKDKSATLLLSSLLIGVIILTPLIQDRVSRPALPWEKSEVSMVVEVGNELKAVTSEGDKIFTFDTAFAVQAGREVLPGMEMELYAFHPTWDTEKCQKYRQVNTSMLLDYLASGEAGAVVLSEGRFFSGRGASTFLDPYRAEIVKVLDENYYLARRFSYPSDSYFGEVYIYLPRQD